MDDIQLSNPSLDKLDIPALINDIPKWATFMKNESIAEWEEFVHCDNLEALSTVNIMDNPFPLHALQHSEPYSVQTQRFTDISNTLERFEKESTTPQVCTYVCNVFIDSLYVIIAVTFVKCTVYVYTV